VSARWSTGWALTTPVEVRQVGTLIYVERCRLPVALVSHPVDQVAAPVDQVGETDPLAARLAELVGAAHAEGRQVGRRTVARHFGITQHRARQLLARANYTNGGSTP
jgi:hypothetical protein